MRVLLLAYACDPTRGSEHGAGWAFLTSYLKQGFQVTLVTQKKNIRNIESRLSFAEKNSLEIVELQLPRIALFIKSHVPFGTQFYYMFWQFRSLLKIRNVDSKIYTFAHHVTFASDSLPSAIFFLGKFRRIWGPVGGISAVDIRNYRFLGIRGAINEVIRTSITGISRYLISKSMVSDLDLVICQNDDGKTYFDRFTKTIVSSNAFVDDAFISTPQTTRVPHMILGVGRLEPAKGWAILIQSLHVLPDKFNFYLVGDGSDYKRLKKLARRLKVQDRVHFLGQKPREQVLELMSKCDLFVFPSLRDAAGWVLCEAATMGTSIVAFDLAAPRSVVGNTPHYVQPKGNLPMNLAKGILIAAGNHYPRRKFWTTDNLLKPIIDDFINQY